MRASTTSLLDEVSGPAGGLNFNLAARFGRWAELCPGHPALVFPDSGTRLTYGELALAARRIGAWLAGGLVGILASRSVGAYAGIMGTAWSGGCYVPLSPKLPEERLLQLLRILNLEALVTDDQGAQRLSGAVLSAGPRRILSEGRPSSELTAAAGRAGVAISWFGALDDTMPPKPAPVADQAPAYVIFTSGTTGTPKGVVVEAGAVGQFLEIMQERYRLDERDRVSQSSELTFDVSVFDMFMSWGAGAALYVVPAAQLMAPSRFIQENALTVWFSVPSTALFMQRMKMLRPGAFPALRKSLFAGEALPLATARAWQTAAPHSTVENLYGPTEATVVCLGHRLDPSATDAGPRGVMAIGEPFPGVTAAIVDADLKPVPEGETGELLVAGRQLARGYFHDPELTAHRFPVVNGRRWYRTGDLARRDESGVYHHLGRIDHQVKVLGHRVELEEVECHLRQVTGSDSVAAVAWPVDGMNVKGIVGFHCIDGLPAGDIRDRLKQRVPPYMVPHQVHCLAELPIGPNGKIDRKALVDFLEIAAGVV